LAKILVSILITLDRHGTIVVKRGCPDTARTEDNMRNKLTLAALALGSTIAFTMPANAQAVTGIASQAKLAVTTDASSVNEVRYRHRHYRHRHWRHRHYKRHRHWGHRRHYRHRPRFGIYLGF
jgi:hypothetical protein